MIAKTSFEAVDLSKCKAFASEAPELTGLVNEDAERANNTAVGQISCLVIDL